jgi:hypothetical protein
MAAAGAVAILVAVALASGSATSASGSREPAQTAAVRSRFALANRCVAVVSATTGRFVAATGSSGYAADTPTKAGATPFYLKPTGLGTYMLYDQHRRVLIVKRTVALGLTLPSFYEWAIAPVSAGSAFMIRSTANGRRLAVATRGGTLELSTASGRRAEFRFEPDLGCEPFPEAQVDATGTTFKGTIATAPYSASSTTICTSPATCAAAAW